MHRRLQYQNRGTHGYFSHYGVFRKLVEHSGERLRLRASAVGGLASPAVKSMSSTVACWRLTLSLTYCAGCLAVYCDIEHDGRITRKPRGEFVGQRLTILDRIEKHLEERLLLTPQRRQAVNDARHRTRSQALANRSAASD